MTFTRRLDYAFRNHPIRFPSILIAVGALFILWPITLTHNAGARLIVLGAIVLGTGLILLPFGLLIAAKRRANVLVLSCPSCHIISHMCAQPFTVERFAALDYAYVVCSQCGADFTVDKYARLA